MKINKIEISSYLQFQDFELDLTYPKGHEKAGQPLEKVCFIGQSGTGKTALLNLIKIIVSSGLIEEYDIPFQTEDDIWAESVNSTDEVRKSFTFEDGTIWWEFKKKVKNIWMRLNDRQLNNFLKDYYKDSNVLISFPAEMNLNLQNIFPEDTKSDLLLSNNKKYTPSVSEVLNSKFFDFEYSNIASVWNQILCDIQKDEIEKLNPMLNRFNLEIRPECDLKTADDLRFIQIYQKGGDSAIPYSGWSTGTKQLIMTATPLLKLNTDKAVILIDKPERSFRPDIQHDLMDFYKELAPKAQFFIATHSPIIAASFEPWEIVKLKFNEEGTIVQEQYFEGERHIDNYKIHTKYLRWDSILNRLFDLEQEGMPDRQAKLYELAELDVRMRKMKQANGSANPEEVKALWEKFKETAELLDWKIQTYREEN